MDISLLFTSLMLPGPVIFGSEWKIHLAEDILELYNNRPSEKAYRHFHPDIEFQDPIGHAVGASEVKSQYNALPKFLSEAQIVYHDLKPDYSNDTIAVELKMHYKVKGIGKDVWMDSLLLLKHKDRLVIRIEERWNHKPIRKGEPSEDSPWWGKVLQAIRRGNAKVLDLLVSDSPPAPAAEDSQ